MEHNYSSSVKKQIARTKNIGTERVRQSAMTAIHDDTEKKFDFEADAYLVRRLINEQHLNSTGARMNMTD